MIKKNKENNNSGITLLALVVTIILLLILSSVSINTLTGENSIIQNAIRARELSEMDNEKEELELASTQAMEEDKYGSISKNRTNSSIR